MRRFSFALLLLLLPILHAEFLVGGIANGEKISILCENHADVFVSQPDGTTAHVLLASYQAEFTPTVPGPYTVQCGKETKTVAVSFKEGAGNTAAGAQQDAFFLAALLVFFGVFMIATLLVANYLFFSRAEFSKTVEKGKARITLQSRSKLEGIEISDPVAVGFAGKEMQMEVPILEAGKKWVFEYELAAGESALPASLTAYSSGQKISMLSTLYIEGAKTAGGNLDKKEPLPRRPVPRAPEWNLR